jgi:hypothetical protein
MSFSENEIILKTLLEKNTEIVNYFDNKKFEERNFRMFLNKTIITKTFVEVKTIFSDITTMNIVIDRVNLTENEKNIIGSIDSTVVIWHKGYSSFRIAFFTINILQKFMEYTVCIPKFYGTYNYLKENGQKEYVIIMEDCGTGFDTYLTNKKLPDVLELIKDNDEIESIKFELTIGEIIFCLCKIDIDDRKYRNFCIKEVNYIRIYQIGDKYFKFDTTVIPIRIDLDSSQIYSETEYICDESFSFKYSFFEGLSFWMMLKCFQLEHQQNVLDQACLGSLKFLIRLNFFQHCFYCFSIHSLIFYFL